MASTTQQWGTTESPGGNGDAPPAPPLGPPSTTPTGPPVHGTGSARGLVRTPSSSLAQGRFGRMFRNLPVFVPEEDVVRSELGEIARRMAAPFDQIDPNPDIPSGYTYLGQFIDHDITFDTASSLERQNDPDALVSFRTPRYDLDSLYGRGPGDQPYLYEKGEGRDPAKLLLGRPATDGDGARDLPRMPDSHVALIGDPRNDENLIVSQLHSVFLRFHNAVVDHVRGRGGFGGASDDDVFKEAQRIVRWHYQWVVVHDFLRRVAGDDVVGDVLRPDGYVVAGGVVEPPRAHLRFYAWHEQPYMPVEFSVAAYRFGHSMIRGRYHLNDFLRDERHSPFDVFSSDRDPLNRVNLNGGRPLPDRWGFQWKHFFDGLDGSGEGTTQPSFRIDERLAPPLDALPFPPPPELLRSLAHRNLLRGVRLELPSGQAVARAMGIEPLTPEELDLGAVAPSFAAHAPLWYYVLSEARVRCEGRRLGPVGGRIVAEVLIGLLWGDPLSYLRVEPSWTPRELDAAHGPSFAMPDLIRFATAS